MREWDTQEACPDYIEAERRTANKNEGSDDFLDRTRYGSVAGELHGNVVPHFPRCCPARVRLRDHAQPP